MPEAAHNHTQCELHNMAQGEPAELWLLSGSGLKHNCEGWPAALEGATKL